MRDAGFVALLLALAASLSWFFSKVHRDGVENYLGLLGGKLFAMVPEGADKEKLKLKYGQFLTEVAARKVAPEQVEKVVVSILNASNASDTLTAEQAEAVLMLAALPEHEFRLVEVLPPPGMPGAPAPALAGEEPAVPSPGAAGFRPEHPPQDWETLNARIKTMYEFNRKLHGELAALPPQAARRHMRYRFEPGMPMMLIVDDSLKREIIRRNNAPLLRDWQRLEREKLVVARQNLGEQMQMEQAHIRRELRRWRDLKRLQQHPPEKNSLAWQALESLKDLSGLAATALLDSAAISQEIEKALKAALIADTAFVQEEINNQERK
jgi:hypothetical protein